MSRNGTNGHHGPPTASAALVASGLTAGYGPIPVIHDINLVIHPGEIVVILGANGAGKTTTILTLAGELKPTAGSVSIHGVEQHGALHQRARAGLGLLQEGLAIFPQLTVLENLRVGPGDPKRAFEYAPTLVPLKNRCAGLCSGGEQRMLAVARALAAQPSVLLADELSLGLAPLITQRLLTLLRQAADNGAAVLLVEQHPAQALAIADRANVMRRGRIVLEGDAADLRGRLDELEHIYLAADAKATSSDGGDDGLSAKA